MKIVNSARMMLDAHGEIAQPSTLTADGLHAANHIKPEEMERRISSH
jgi:hypothetical protein